MDKLNFEQLVKLIRRCDNPFCGQLFIPESGKQKFCHRDCFQSVWNSNQKVSKYPSVVCEWCGEKTALDFWPLASSLRWSEWKCPKCGKSPQENEEERVDGCVIL